jgi:hypothetical protein
MLPLDKNNQSKVLIDQVRAAINISRAAAGKANA